MKISNLIIYFCLCLSSADVLANSISFEFITKGSAAPNYDNKLSGILEASNIFKKLNSFVDRNLKLTKNVRFIFKHQDTAYSNAHITEESNEQQIFIPFSILYQLYQGINQKFPQQSDVGDRIYISAVEKHLWFEFGRVLINQFSLSTSGNDDYLLDNFSTLMLINLSDFDSDYILDATEAYLLAERSQPLIKEENFTSELEIDEHRYRVVVCLILGKDINIENNQALNDTKEFTDLLSNLSWKKTRLSECRDLYQQKLLSWYQALLPHLKENNQLKSWIKTLHPR